MSSSPRVVPSFPNVPIAGGAGTVPAWGRADFLISAPGGIATATPAAAVWSVGTNATLAADQDIHLGSQRNTALAIKNGLSLFTYGKAQSANKPNTETGMQLHAASGSVSVQAQANTLSLTADRSISTSSTNDAVTMGSPKHVLLTAGGASLRITNGSITLTTSGAALFKAAMKELTGAGSAAAPHLLFGSTPLKKHYLRFVATNTAGKALVGKKYALMLPDGSTKTGTTDNHGRTEKIETDGPQRISIYIQDSDHEGFYVTESE